MPTKYGDIAKAPKGTSLDTSAVCGCAAMGSPHLAKNFYRPESVVWLKMSDANAAGVGGCSTKQMTIEKERSCKSDRG